MTPMSRFPTSPATIQHSTWSHQTQMNAEDIRSNHLDAPVLHNDAEGLTRPWGNRASPLPRQSLSRNMPNADGNTADLAAQMLLIAERQAHADATATAHRVSLATFIAKAAMRSRQADAMQTRLSLTEQ